MKYKIFLLLFIFLLTSCSDDKKISSDKWNVISQNVKYKDDNEYFYLKSGKNDYTIPKKNMPYNKAIFLNASLLGYALELGLEDKILGVSSPEYIYSSKIKAKIANGSIHNVGDERKYDVEKILALKPDVIFSNYISTFEGTYEVLEENGIEVIFLDEYLETVPLKRAEYLLVFGKMFGVEEKSKDSFNEIKNQYNILKNISTKSVDMPLVLANEIYGNQWYMPGGNSLFSNFMKDAGARYILENDKGAGAVPLSFEEVYVKAQDAQIWLNAGNHSSKKTMLHIVPAYIKMNVFKNGKIYALTEREKDKSNDFFESGVVRVDWILKDYIYIFYPQLLPNHKLIYMKELK